MKSIRLIALATLLMCMAGVAIAQEDDAPKKKRPGKRPPGIFGKITAVDGKVLTVAKRTRGSKETTEVKVTTDDNTKFTLDRKEATLADMKEGLYVFITPETGTAERVHARTEMGRGKGKDGDKGKGKDRKKKEE